MHVLITGASGYVGGAIAARLVAAGHHVAALARSDEATAAVRALGAEPIRGDLVDGRVVQAAAARADAVIHAAVDYARPDWGDVDRLGLDALLAGVRGRPVRFVLTSTTLVYGDTGPEPATEDRPVDPAGLQPFKVEAERRVLDTEGIRATVVRPGLAHGRGGSLTLRGMLAGAAEHGAATFIGDGSARWSAVHVDDLADLYAALLERDGPTGVLNAAASPAPSMREIAEAIGARAGVPATSITLEQATEAMGPFAVAFTRDLVVDASRAERLMGWRPRQVGLLEDLRGGSYAVEVAPAA